MKAPVEREFGDLETAESVQEHEQLKLGGDDLLFTAADDDRACGFRSPVAILDVRNDRHMGARGERNGVETFSPDG